MFFLSKYNLSKLFETRFKDRVLVFPDTDQTFSQFSFLKQLDQLGVSYYFKWCYEEDPQSEKLIERFMSSYIYDKGSMGNLIDKIYAGKNLDYEDVLNISQTKEIFIEGQQSACTKRGYFEEYIYLYMDDHQSVDVFFNQYFSAYEKDLLFQSSEERFFKFKKQKDIFTKYISQQFDDYGIQFMFDFVDAGLYLKEVTSRFEQFDCLHFLLYLSCKDYIKVQDFYSKPIMKNNFEKDRYEIVDYKFFMTIKLNSKWFHEMDEKASEHAYVARSDFFLIKYNGDSYKLSEKQAKFTSFLYHTHKKTGMDKVLYKEVKNHLEIYCDSTRSVRDLFRISKSNTHPLYKTLIKFDENNNYYLDPTFVREVYFIPLLEFSL